MPIPEADARLLRSGDRFLIAFPRSGSRWLFKLITHALSRSVGVAIGDLWDPTGLDDGPAAGRPALASGPPAVCDLYARGVDRSFKQAHGVPSIFRAHDLTQFLPLRGAPIVYLFRDPADALSSWLQFQRVEDPSAASLDAAEFSSEQLTHWMRQMELALAEAEARPERLLLRRYESVLLEPAVELRRALDFFGVVCPDEHIEDAGRRLGPYLDELNAHRARQTWAAGLGPRGRPGRAAIELEAHVRETIERRAGPLYEQACKAAEKLTPASR